MSRRTILSTQQRGKALIELITDAREKGFNEELIQKYKAQLKEIQEELKRDKERKLNFNRVKRGLN